MPLIWVLCWSVGPGMGPSAEWRVECYVDVEFDSWGSVDTVVQVQSTSRAGSCCRRGRETWCLLLTFISLQCHMPADWGGSLDASAECSVCKQLCAPQYIIDEVGLYSRMKYGAHFHTSRWDFCEVKSRRTLWGGCCSLSHMCCKLTSVLWVKQSFWQCRRNTESGPASDWSTLDS